MIISWEHQFLFIKTAKTAGTSVEIEYSQLLGPGEVVTPVHPSEEGLRPRNFAECNYGCCGAHFRSHSSADYVRHSIGNRKFSKLFKFCIEREPVDKCLSHWSMWRNSPAHISRLSTLSWPEYVSNGRFPNNVNLWTDANGKLLVDRILRYENLDEELLDVARVVGLTRWNGLRQKAKSGFREHVLVTQEEKLRIYESFRQSNEHTGYELAALGS